MAFNPRAISTALASMAFICGVSVAQAGDGKASGPDPISEGAAVYATFHSDVSNVRNKPLASASDIETTLNNLGGQNPDKLSSGWLAYSAMIAAQDPEYREAVRDIASFYGEDSLRLGLRNDIRYARTLSGGTGAVTSALGATQADRRRLEGAGAYVKEQAYSLQGTSWAKARVANTQGLINGMRTTAISGRPVRGEINTAFGGSDIDAVLSKAAGNSTESLWDGVTTAAGAVNFPDLSLGYSGRDARIRAGKEPIADKIATLAAYRVLGAEDMPASEMRTALKERSTKNCLNMAQLNLHQCVAAAHKQYEVPFCIGEHALTEVGTCIGDVTQ
ncbi:MAG: hypothetical protein AAF253_09990 [Pseudomonadota bacterium]